MIYKITPDGKGAPFYKTNATHATALAFDKAGNLLVGTGSPGRVLRLDPDGKPFVLLDSPFQEIHVLRFDDKGVLLRRRAERPPHGRLAGAARTKSAADQPAPRRIARRSRRVIGVDRDHRDRGRRQRRAARRRRLARISGPSKARVYRINPDGVWDQLWESREDSPYDLSVRSERRA